MKYFKYSDFERSAKAKKLGIDNTADEAIRHNIKALVDNVLDPLREAFGGPVEVSSGYRCPKVNNAAGGSRTSQHMKGQAADIYAVLPKGATYKEQIKANKQLGVIIAGTLPFDQLIFENCDDNLNCVWIHVSYSESYNRKEIKKKSPGSHQYPIIQWEDIASTL